MKRLLTSLLAATLLSAPAFAQAPGSAAPPAAAEQKPAPKPAHKKKLSQVKPGAAWLMNDYLGCETAREHARSKDLKDVSCQDRTTIHYCSIFEDMPKDMQANVALEVYCNFLADEHAGNVAEEEKIMEAATKAGCLTGDEVREKLADKYKKDDDAVDSLRNFTQALLNAEDACYTPENKEAKE